LLKNWGQKVFVLTLLLRGPIETDFNSATIRNNPELKNRLGSITPLGRVGNAEDIGAVVAFLFTEDARWINGQRIEVSGGINV
jgi:NAD(P)-dependent dehydrogenase (short-subunit alcohol dehydrogenase family)